MSNTARKARNRVENLSERSRAAEWDTTVQDALEDIMNPVFSAKGSEVVLRALREYRDRLATERDDETDEDMISDMDNDIRYIDSLMQFVENLPIRMPDTA